MKEIQFRVWNPDNRIMVYGAELVNTGSGTIVDVRCGALHAEYQDSKTLSWNEAELMQYIGLHNKNGKELYEEDIVVLDYVTKEHAKCVICYDSKQARYKAVPISTYKSNSGSGGWTGFELFTNCEIIGNVYENPELIGGSNT